MDQCVQQDVVHFQLIFPNTENVVRPDVRGVEPGGSVDRTEESSGCVEHVPPRRGIRVHPVSRHSQVAFPIHHQRGVCGKCGVWCSLDGCRDQDRELRVDPGFGTG